MLHLIIGPMFSGKTTELCRRMERCTLAGKKYQFVRSSKDTRTYLTHTEKEADIHDVIYRVEKLSEVPLHEFRIFIDEGNFFDDVDEWCLTHWDSHDITIALLNGSAEGKPLKHGSSLINYADDVTYLTAICSKCGHENASMSVYYGGKKKEILVTDEGYDVLCPQCWKAYQSNRSGI